MNFTYPLKVNNITIAEIEGFVEFDRNGAFDVSLYSILGNVSVRPPDYLKVLIEGWLQNEKRIAFQEAQADAACGIKTYDREIARGL